MLSVVLWMALPGGPHLWTFLFMPAGFGTIYAGARYSPNLKRHTEPGERWQKIGDLSNL